MNNENVKRFTQIIMEMRETYEKKNADYGNSFEETIDKCGLMVPAGRMYDKWKRFLTLLENASRVDDESIIDTLTDLANYAVMTRMYIENHSQKREGDADDRGGGVDESARVNRKFYKETEE